jgi:hypothetical protein
MTRMEKYSNPEKRIKIGKILRPRKESGSEKYSVPEKNQYRKNTRTQKRTMIGKILGPRKEPGSENYSDPEKNQRIRIRIY